MSLAAVTKFHDSPLGGWKSEALSADTTSVMILRRSCICSTKSVSASVSASRAASAFRNSAKEELSPFCAAAVVASVLATVTAAAFDC
jgi:hypothetical protein